MTMNDKNEKEKNEEGAFVANGVVTIRPTYL